MMIQVDLNFQNKCLIITKLLLLILLEFKSLPKTDIYFFEYLLCKEEQYSTHNTTPFTSQSNKHWFKNQQKFTSL